MTTKPNYQAPTYCSDDCKLKAREKRRKPRFCTVCGVPIEGQHGNRKRCDKHKWKNNSKPVRRVTLTCRWCLADFVTTAGYEDRRLCCSRSCYGSLTYHMQMWGSANKCVLPECVVCGNLTGKPPAPRRRDRGLGSSTYRCSACELPANEATNGSKNAKKRRRDSVRAGEKFTVHDLIERDGDWCHIGWCNSRVRFDVDSMHPRYGTIDHVVPIVNGGEHVMANARVACRECNCRRGARELRDAEVEQLRLIA